MKFSTVRVPRRLTLLAVPILAAAVLFAAAVAVTVAAQVTVRITVTPRSEETVVPLTVVDPKAATDTDLPGIIREVTVDTTGTAKASDTGAVDAKARGTVTIENHWNQPQPLAATTRLLSEGGVLFRTTARVDVPAGGTADVTVEADQPGAAGNVAPGRFTIVALWLGLQEKIFGTSKTSMSGGGATTAVVSAEDLVTAENDAHARAATAAHAALTENPPTGLSLLENSVAAATAQTLKRSTVGDAAESASVKVRATVRGLITDPTRITGAVTTTLTRQYPGEKIIEVKTRPDVSNAALPGGPFTVQVTLKLVPDDRILAPDRVAGKTMDAATTELSRVPGVTAVQIHGLPFWTKRLPGSAARIRVLVVQVRA